MMRNQQPLQPHLPHRMGFRIILLWCLMGFFMGTLFMPGFSRAEEKTTTDTALTPSPAAQTRMNQEELQTLKDRVTFLEEQQSSILDEIAERVILGGYGALEFESFNEDHSTFEAKLELLVSGQIHDRIRFYNEIELGVDETKAEQAYVDFLLAQWVNFRGGVLLVPFGKFNLDHFDPRRDLTDRPIVNTYIIPTTWSDLGVGLFGLIPLSPDIKSTYEIQVINGLQDNFEPPSDGLKPTKPGFKRDNNGNKAVVGRGTFKFLDQYEIGVSGYTGEASDTDSNLITGYGMDWEFKPRGLPTWEDFEIKGEFANFDVQGSTAPSRLFGLYTQVNYHFWFASLNNTVFGRPFNHPTFTAVFRYDHAKINTTGGIGNLMSDRYTLGFNYRPIEDYVIKTEYQFNNGNFARNSGDGFIFSIAWLF